MNLTKQERIDKALELLLSKNRKAICAKSFNKVSELEKEIVTSFSDEKRFNVLQLFEVVNTNGMDDIEHLRKAVGKLKLNKDFISRNRGYDNYSIYDFTFTDKQFLRLSFAGFTEFSYRKLNEKTEEYYDIYYPVANIFQVIFFKAYKTGKIYAQFKFHYRRRNELEVNHFSTETSYFIGWAMQKLGVELKSFEMRNFFSKHLFPDKFEISGFKVRRMENRTSKVPAPVELKFLPEKNSPDMRFVHNVIDDYVIPELVPILAECFYGKVNNIKQRNSLKSNLKNHGISKYFFNASHRAFLSGFGKIRLKAGSSPTGIDIDYKIEYPADENSQVRVAIGAAPFLEIIYNELYDYLETL
ncbi:hypothetical protein ACRXCV_12995 [Halobacteriovorax sp. GFR7]|uniref:hypothetical protein n=1 Tax=unclassified Halobacteriovorax TaxID=2639665 RepID=UPI003D95C235